MPIGPFRIPAWCSPAVRRRERFHAWCAEHLDAGLADAGFVPADEEEGFCWNTRVYARTGDPEPRAYVKVQVNRGFREERPHIAVTLGHGGWRGLEYTYSGIPLERYTGRAGLVEADELFYLVPARDPLPHHVGRRIAGDLFGGAADFLAGRFAAFFGMRAEINRARPEPFSFNVRRGTDGEEHTQPGDGPIVPLLEDMRKWRERYSR